MPFRNRGRCYVVKQLYDQAIEDYSRAIQLDPADARVFWIEYAYARRGMHKLAVSDFDQAIARDPKNTNFLWSRAHSYSELSDHDRAI